jgi:dipeptidase
MTEYSPTSMFWLVNRIAQFAYLRYNHIGKEIREIIDEHENAKIAETAAIDQAALSMSKSSPGYVREFITSYSVNTANSLFKKWKELDEYLLVKYIDGNTKKQNPDGTFMNNGYCDSIPPTPNFPGYTKEWKEAVIKETGEKLRIND